jgi:hypothetical protein
MNTPVKQSAPNVRESSFESTLEETLAALHKRRLEINSLLRHLEAKRRKGSERTLKVCEASSRDFSQTRSKGNRQDGVNQQSWEKVRKTIG